MKFLLILIISLINLNIFSKNLNSNINLPKNYNSFKYELLNLNNISKIEFKLTREDYALIITNTLITTLFFYTNNNTGLKMGNEYLYFLIPDLFLSGIILLIKYVP